MKKLRLYLITLTAALALPAITHAQSLCSAAFTVVVGPPSPAGTIVSFFDSSFAAGTITSWSWTFSTGQVSSQQNPVITVLNSNSVVACLTITAMWQGQTCTATTCDTVYISFVPPVCNSNFGFQVSQNTAYFNAVTGGNVLWTWDFGDGSSGTGANPVHTYAASGSYQVCLTVLDANGTTCTTCQNVNVNVTSGCQAYFTFGQVPGTVLYNFIDQSQGSPTNWYWTFGDGTSSTLQNPQHSYTGTGPYQVCLTITDSAAGCSDTYCDSLYINSMGQCQASFTATTNPVGNSVSFTNTSVPSTATYFWDFGDGTTSTQTSPTHTYANPGTYTVCLTITSSFLGCTDTYCGTVTVGSGSGCSSNFAIYPDSTVAHTYWAVNLASGTGGLTYIWSWGDGTSSTGPYPSHTYASSGFYTICLTITDATGCTSTTCYQWQLLRLSSSSVPVTINVIPGATGIPTDPLAVSFSAYPNPATDVLYADFSLEQNSNVSVKLYNIAGQNALEVASTSYGPGNHQLKLDVSSLPKGMYLLKVETEGSVAQSKVLIQ